MFGIQCLYCCWVLLNVYELESRRAAPLKMDRYIVSGRIGEGAHGIVLKAIDKVTMKVVAMKRLSLKNMSDQGLPNSAIRELLALRLVQHEYVANLVDYFPQGLSLILVCEYFPTDLYEYLRSNTKPLPLGHVKAYLWMLAKAIDYIHSLGIMHRDLKPANLLIAPTGELKVTDFGLCRLFSADNHSHNDEHPKKNKIQYTHQVASRWYRAPELLYGSRDYGPEIDLWALGCIFGELLKNSPLFPGENDIAQLCTVIQVLGTPTEENWPGVSQLPDYHKISFTETRRRCFREILPSVDEASISFLERFLRYFPSKRITASQILEDDYFSSNPPMTPLSEMPKPAQKSLASTTGEFTNWDWSAKDFS